MIIKIFLVAIQLFLGRKNISGHVPPTGPPQVLPMPSYRKKTIHPHCSGMEKKLVKITLISRWLLDIL
jgi:hypothetical protein